MALEEIKVPLKISSAGLTMLAIKPSPKDLAATHPFSPPLAGYSPRTLLKCSRALPYTGIASGLPNFP